MVIEFFMPSMPCLSGMGLQPLATELSAPGISIHPAPSDRLCVPVCVCVCLCLHVLCCAACSQLNVTHCGTSKKQQLKTQVLCLSVGQVVMMLGVDCSLLSGEYESEMVVTSSDQLNTAFSLLALSCLPLLFPTSLKKTLFSLCFSCNTSKELKLETTGKTLYHLALAKIFCCFTGIFIIVFICLYITFFFSFLLFIFIFLFLEEFIKTKFIYFFQNRAD